jgi:ketosteroid isomerase-like protein
MPISDADVQELLAALDRGRDAWISGQLDFGPGLDAEQDPDMTIFGPWGGEAGRGPGLPDRQQAMARLFHGGTGTTELVKTIVSGDIVVVVLIERNEITVEGVAEPQPWVLRTTQVFERRDGTWVRLHRHADPLIDRRTPADTFAIARGGAA